MYWRMTDLWDNANKNKPLPPAGGGGWNDGQVMKIHDSMPAASASPINNSNTFDVVVINYNSWISPENITQQRYEIQFN